MLVQSIRTACVTAAWASFRSETRANESLDCSCNTQRTFIWIMTACVLPWGTVAVLWSVWFMMNTELRVRVSVARVRVWRQSHANQPLCVGFICLAEMFCLYCVTETKPSRFIREDLELNRLKWFSVSFQFDSFESPLLFIIFIYSSIVSSRRDVSDNEIITEEWVSGGSLG